MGFLLLLSVLMRGKELLKKQNTLLGNKTLV
jgi:hypothetical protein